MCLFFTFIKKRNKRNKDRKARKMDGKARNMDRNVDFFIGHIELMKENNRQTFGKHGFSLQNGISVHPSNSCRCYSYLILN